MGCQHGRKNTVQPGAQLEGGKARAEKRPREGMPRLLCRLRMGEDCQGGRNGASGETRACGDAFQAKETAPESPKCPGDSSELGASEVMGELRMRTC